MISHLLLPSGAAPAPFLGVNFSPLSRHEIVERILAGIDRSTPCRLLVTANVDHIVRLAVDKAFSAAYEAAWISTADGAPVALACRLAGVALGGRVTGVALGGRVTGVALGGRVTGVALGGRVTGADLFDDVMRGLDSARHRPVFAVADHAIAAALESRLRSIGMADPDFRILVPPMGFERDATAGEELLAAVEAIAATHLFMGIGAPRSEIFIHTRRHRLGGVIAMCVGAGVAYHLGVKRRAPAILRRLGLEWSWRLLEEPRRLARRYLVDSRAFAAILARELLFRHGATGPRAR